MAPVTEILIGLAVVSILIVAFAAGRFVPGQAEGGLEVSVDCDDSGDGGGDGGGD